MVGATWFSQVLFTIFCLTPFMISLATYSHLNGFFLRYCLRHFVNNFHDKFKNSNLKVLAYRVGSQNQIRIMEEIGKLNPQARQTLTHSDMFIF